MNKYKKKIINNKMQNIDLNCEKEAFVLAWSASIWKRIWRCILLYCNHQNISVTSTIMMKCLKYNLLCPTGIVFQMLPYLEKAFLQGFLMPREYEKNEYVRRAIRLFGEAYRIVKLSNDNIEVDNIQKNEGEKILFMRDYSSTISTDKEQYRKEEEEDILAFPGFTSTNSKNNTNNTKHQCSFCELVDAWDIDLTLYTTQSSIHTILLQTLLLALKKNK